MKKEVTDIKCALVRIETNLAEHMRRTQIAEKRIDMTEESLKGLGQTIWMAKGAVGLFSFISAVAACYIMVKQLL